LTFDSLLYQHSSTDLGATNFPVCVKVWVIIYLRHLGVIQTTEQGTCWRNTIRRLRFETQALSGDCQNGECGNYDRNVEHFVLKLCCPGFKSIAVCVAVNKYIDTFHTEGCSWQHFLLIRVVQASNHGSEIGCSDVSRVFPHLLQLSTKVSQYSNTSHSLTQPLRINVYKQADHSALHVYSTKTAQISKRRFIHSAGNVTSWKLKFAVCVNIVMLQHGTENFKLQVSV
jgi:hypothetical protein